MAATGWLGGWLGGNATGGGGGGAAPTIANMTPTPGLKPGSVGAFSADPRVAARTAIQFDVTDAVDGILAVIIIARFGDALGLFAPTYVVHNGTRFLPPFAQGSVRTSITNGWHYSVLYDTGWPAAPHFDIIAIDAAGNITGGSLPP